MPFKTILIAGTKINADLVKAQLESEGIEVLLVKSYATYDHDLDSTKIQVQKKDFSLANSVLLRHGYIDILPKKNTMLHDIDNYTKKLPIVKNWSFEIRLITFVLLCIALLISIILIMYDLN